MNTVNRIAAIVMMCIILMSLAMSFIEATSRQHPRKNAIIVRDTAGFCRTVPFFNATQYAIGDHVLSDRDDSEDVVVDVITIDSEPAD